MSNFSSSSAQEFYAFLKEALANKTLHRLVISKYCGEEKELEKITFRPIVLQNQDCISAVYRYKTQDVTKNYDYIELNDVLKGLIDTSKQINLWTTTQEIQLKKAKKKDILTHKNIELAQEPKQMHNREKQRYVDQNSVFLQDLSITDQQHRIVPTMAKKWKQINKFIEIFGKAVEGCTQKDQQLHVVDFGSGKGYLTFAMYDYLQNQEITPYITGVELRDNLVDFCQKVAKKNNFNHLDFFQGDVRSYQPEKLDVMVALHACDIATDFAIHCGIRLNASVIMCAPCCHKELRPQLTSPEVLKPMLAYGIHQAQQAEMLTDTIRAMLLQAYGYETKVFEFVSAEHTNKNKMILAVKQKDVVEPNAKILEDIQKLKAMYGIEQHSLEKMLSDELVDQERLGCRC